MKGTKTKTKTKTKTSTKKNTETNIKTKITFIVERQAPVARWPLSTPPTPAIPFSGIFFKYELSQNISKKVFSKYSKHPKYFPQVKVFTSLIVN